MTRTERQLISALVAKANLLETQFQQERHRSQARGQRILVLQRKLNSFQKRNYCAYCGDPTKNAYACRQHQDLLSEDAGTGLSNAKSREEVKRLFQPK